MDTIIIYLIATVIFFAIDMLWLGVIAKKFYRDKLGFILSPDVNWIPAIIFYLIFIGGILYFAIMPAMEVESWQKALMQGSVLGFLCYATYDLTNMATIKKWPVSIVIVDIIWGTALTGSVALLSYLAANLILA